MDERILIEIKRLKSIFRKIDKQKLKVVDGLISEASFMRVTLMDLKTEVEKDGPLDWFEQGDNAYYREHPALKAYNTMVKNYIACVKQLSDLLPKEDASQADELLDFVNKKRRGAK